MDYPWSQVLYAFGLTLFAGLATGIGSAIAFFTRRTDYRTLSWGLGFSAGAMLYVSFTEILGKADAALSHSFGNRAGGLLTAASFFGGILLILVIDRIIPSAENPHEPRNKTDIRLLKADVELTSEERARAAMTVLATGDSPSEGKSEADVDHASLRRAGLLRMALFAGVAITAHNFPEGMVTFLSALSDPGVGLLIAVAIALHNIPEGLSVAVPLFFATGSRSKAFTLSLLSGLAEPVGAAIGFLVLRPYLNEAMVGVLFGAIAGIMVFISVDELLPAARQYGQGHQTVYGTIVGMAVMAISLILFR